MSNNKTTIEELYQNMVDQNISKVLPILDEQITIKLADSLPFGGEFVGREGFISMVSKINQAWEHLSSIYLHYFLPNDSSDSHILVEGKMTGKAFSTDEIFSFHFVNLWELKNDKVITLKIFFDDAAELRQYLTNTDIDPESLNSI